MYIEFGSSSSALSLSLCSMSSCSHLSALFKLLSSRSAALVTGYCSMSKMYLPNELIISILTYAFNPDSIKEIKTSTSSRYTNLRDSYDDYMQRREQDVAYKRWQQRLLLYRLRSVRVLSRQFKACVDDVVQQAYLSSPELRDEKWVRCLRNRNT